jgi:hypothetical protein
MFLQQHDPPVLCAQLSERHLQTRGIAPSRRKIGECTTSLIVRFEMAMSSIAAPSTISSAKPRQLLKTQSEMVMVW